MTNNLESIKSEIRLHRGVEEETDWLFRKGFIYSPYDSYNFRLISDWTKGGDECFTMAFSVDSARLSISAIAKACVKFSPIEAVDDWMKRRDRLVQFGVGVPRLYSRFRATYIEEFIEHDIKSAYKAASETEKASIESCFYDTCTSIARAGFSPISLHDVRSRGSDVVVIDFGSDLGNYVESCTNPNEVDHLIEFKKLTR